MPGLFSRCLVQQSMELPFYSSVCHNITDRLTKTWVKITQVHWLELAGERKGRHLRIMETNEASCGLSSYVSTVSRWQVRFENGGELAKQYTLLTSAGNCHIVTGTKLINAT